MAVGLAGTAARDALEALGLKPGELVLVSGAVGGVGAIAVPRAVAARAVYPHFYARAVLSCLG